ncbi:MAG: MaoC family dehydratase [Chloroflexi bacterium]|nr:MaoC family dehydratase [Chloroflexota bacterium]
MSIQSETVLPTTPRVVRVGSTASFSKVVTQRDVETFADLSGDYNPVHLNDEYAANTRFRRRIVHGIYTAGLISAALATELAGPDKTVIYLNQNLKFLKPVHHDDTITAKLEVLELDEVRNIAKVRTDCFNQRDEQVVSGEAVILLDRYPN